MPIRGTSSLCNEFTKSACRLSGAAPNTVKNSRQEDKDGLLGLDFHLPRLKNGYTQADNETSHTQMAEEACARKSFCDQLLIPGSEIASILSAPCSEDELFFWSLPDKSGSVRGVEASEAGLLSLSPISRFCSCTADLLSGVDASFSGTFSAPQALFGLLN